QADRWQDPLLQWQLKSLLPDDRAAPTDLAFVNLSQDADHLLRRQPLLIRANDSAVYHFAYALFALQRHPRSYWETTEHFFFSDERIALEAEERLRINYCGPPGSFRRIPIAEVLNAERQGQPMSELREMIAIVGAAPAGGTDRHATPYANSVATRLAGRKP